MTEPVPARAASAARIGGDDYQHLVSWNESLLALRRGSGATHVTVEAADAGNLDDIVVEYADGPTVYTQAKHAVDAQTPVGAGYLLTPGRGRSERARRSLLQRFHDSWQQLRQHNQLSMQLVTDREIDPNDVVLANIDRRTECLVPAIFTERQHAASLDALQEWAAHLDVDAETLSEFLADLRLRTGRPKNAELERAETLMWGHGLRTGRRAAEAGIACVRDWVQQHQRRLNVDALEARVADFVETAGEPGAVLVVEAIGDDPHPEDATERLRWVERYIGEDPDSRRELADPSDWETTIGPEIEAVAQRLRTAGHTRVIVRGALRLPVWFAVGAALRHVHGFDVAALQHDAIWSSESATSPLQPQPVPHKMDAGDDLAVAISITTDATRAVQRHISSENLPVGRLLVLQPADGPSPQALPSGPAAARLAVGLRQAIIDELDEHPAEHIHLFMAAPGGLALLVGHRWNALRPTTVYEHLGAGRGYARTLTVRS